MIVLLRSFCGIPVWSGHGWAYRKCFLQWLECCRPEAFTKQRTMEALQNHWTLTGFNVTTDTDRVVFLQLLLPWNSVNVRLVVTSVPLEGLKSQAAFEEMRQNYIRELTKVIHLKEKGVVASSQRFYHLTKLMDSIHDVSLSSQSCSLSPAPPPHPAFTVSVPPDREEGQPVLPEHLHPGRRHEGGVPRDDVGGHCLPTS